MIPNEAEVNAVFTYRPGEPYICHYRHGSLAVYGLRYPLFTQVRPKKLTQIISTVLWLSHSHQRQTNNLCDSRKSHSKRKDGRKDW
jgi:hypothetical protein